MTKRGRVRLRAVKDPRSTDARWRSGLAELQTFVEQHGRLPTPSENKAGWWVNEIRREYFHTIDKTLLEPSKLATLEAIPGWYWRVSTKHNLDFRVGQIKAWLSLNPHIEGLEANHSMYFDFNLEKWISKRREEKRLGLLAKHEIELIESIPAWKWVPKRIYRRSFIEREILWRLKTSLDALVRSGSAAGATQLWDCDMVLPLHRIVVEYDGAWSHAVREAVDRAKTEDLMLAGWRVIRIREAPLVALYPADMVVSSSEEVGVVTDALLILLVRHGVPLLNKRIDHLPKFQGLREQADDPWYEGLAILKEYILEHGDALVPAPFVDASGYRLGQWVYVQRRARKRELLSERKIRLLQDIPEWVWSRHTQVKVGWDAAFVRTQEYLATEKTLPWTKATSPDGFQLGRWVVYQRSVYRKGELSPKRISLLETLPGWWWERNPATCK